MKNKNGSDLLDEALAAAYIGISVATLRRERYRDRIGFYRVAGWRIKYSVLAHLQPYLNERCQPMARPNARAQSAA
jgi:hypothetical protein